MKTRSHVIISGVGALHFNFLVLFIIIIHKSQLLFRVDLSPLEKNPSKKRLTANVRLSLNAPHARSGEGNLINNVTFPLPSLPLAMHTCESQSASDTFRYGFSEARNTRKPGLELKIACQYTSPGQNHRAMDGVQVPKTDILARQLVTMNDVLRGKGTASSANPSSNCGIMGMGRSRKSSLFPTLVRVFRISGKGRIPRGNSCTGR